jgi:hypothetical protein
MHFFSSYGAWLARSTLTLPKARALVGAGLQVVILQVEWQRSRLAQRTAATLIAEHSAALAAGLQVWWWAWCTPTLAREAGRRPAGPRELERRLAALVAEVGAPAGFFVDAEVGGLWRPRALPELPDVAAAARAAGMPRVGLSSHARISSAWSAEAFDLGSPQFYDDDPVTKSSVREWLATWEAAPCLWPTLGCADSSSTSAEMRGDLRTLAELEVPGALWWTARQLRKDNGRLAAAVRPVP